jgi:hypothetical protein
MPSKKQFLGFSDHKSTNDLVGGVKMIEHIIQTLFDSEIEDIYIAGAYDSNQALVDYCNRVSNDNDRAIQ